MDPITDMLNQIRNAVAVKKPELLLSFSNIKYEIAKILSEQGFIGEIKKNSKGKHKELKIILKYNDGISALSGVQRVSRQGQKIYQQVSEIKKIHGGYGISIISTSRGLMTNKDAKKQKLGGEVLLEAW